MDHTLNKLWESFTDQLSIMHGKDMRIGREELYVYRITDNFPEIPKAQWFNITNDIFTTPGFWENIPVMEDAPRVMAELIEEYNVYILTKPWIHYDKCIAEKYNWIRTHFPFFDLNKVVFTGDKHLLTGDWFIDDAPDYMSGLQGDIIAMAYPYNKEFKTNVRVSNWKEIGKFFNVWHS